MARRSAGYRADLAFIHDAGFSDFVAKSARFLLGVVPPGGRVVDLGCGSGTWARRLTDAGHDVLGIDASAAMIALARAAAPAATLRAGSFVDARLPPCDAVTALGEVFNYLFDARNGEPALLLLFRRIHAALRPGGVLVFDVSTPGRVPGGGPTRDFRIGDGWVVLVERTEDRRRRALTRAITTFRRVGARWRRDDELHRLRLYRPRDVLAALRRSGFRARTLRGYGELTFPPGVVGFLARRAD